jgi:hypothetical protein
MKINRTIAIAVAAGVAALAAGGVGIAAAVGGDSDEPVAGPDAEKAKSAALEAVGGGTVLEVEREDGDGGVFEVEVRRSDGSQVEVQLDGRYRPVGTAADDDSESESVPDGGEGADRD